MRAPRPVVSCAAGWAAGCMGCVLHRLLKGHEGGTSRKFCGAAALNKRRAVSKLQGSQSQTMGDLHSMEDELRTELMSLRVAQQVHSSPYLAPPLVQPPTLFIILPRFEHYLSSPETNLPFLETPSFFPSPFAHEVHILRWGGCRT